MGVLQLRKLYSVYNVKNRLRFVKEHVNWTREQWSRVLYLREQINASLLGILTENV